MRFALLLLISWPVIAADLPAGIAAAGASYNSQGSPKAGGWVSIAYLLTKTGGGTYSYTTSDITMLRRKAQASMRTGAAQVLHQYGPVTLLALAEAGVATTGTATGGALTAGGVVAWQIKGWAILGCLRRVGTTIGTTQNVVELGFGRTF